MTKLLLTIILLITTFSVYGQIIDVFTLTSMPAVNAGLVEGVHIYQVNNHQLDQSINQVMINVYQQTHSEKATIAAIKAFASKHQAGYAHMGKGMQKLMRYQITRIPSIIIDGQYQVLGTTNVAAALQAFHHYQITLKNGGDR